MVFAGRPATLNSEHDGLIQLTWQTRKAFVWDKTTFAPLGEFTYGGEGWGLCRHGADLVMSDGSDTLFIRDGATFEIKDRVPVQIEGEPLPSLNELECVGDTVYANIWAKPFIVRIETGYLARDQYKIATLFRPGKPWTQAAPQEQYAHKLMITHGGNCDIAYGVDGAPSVTDYNPVPIPYISLNTNEKALAEGFAGSGYDLKFLIRAITRTRAYQLSSLPSSSNKHDEALFSKHPLRRLMPEQLVPSVVMSSGIAANKDVMENPLVKLLLDDADLRGNSLDTFLSAFALQAKARGSMLLLVDLARDSSPLLSLLDQVQRRRVPYLRAIAPELVDEFDVDDETGLLERVRIKAIEIVGGKAVEVDREWTHEGWSVRRDGTVVAEGTHPFGQCPALAFTESGDPFPVVGKYSQVADLSRRIFNARSELDEILRSQTFSLLTLQVPPEADDKAVAGATAAIGTHSMLVHRGTTAPSFIAPDSGPAQTYLAVIDQLQASIRRVTMEESTSDASSAAESGVARRMRFEALNADLAVFASRMQQLERRMWALFHRALGTTPRNTVEWPSDFNLLDTQAELDILLSMQSTGFPPLVQAAKRKAIAGAEFDAADEETKAAVMAAIDEQAQEAPAGAPLPST